MPILNRQGPRSERLNQSNLTPPLDDAPYQVALAGAVEVVADCVGVRGRADDDHADAHVEGSVHLRFGDVADLLHDAEDRGHGPTAACDFDGGAFGQDARDVLKESAARDVRERLDDSGVEQTFERSKVTEVRLQKGLADGHAERI